MRLHALSSSRDRLKLQQTNVQFYLHKLCTLNNMCRGCLPPIADLHNLPATHIFYTDHSRETTPAKPCVRSACHLCSTLNQSLMCHRVCQFYPAHDTTKKVCRAAQSPPD